MLGYRAAYLHEADWDGALIRFWASVEACALRSIEEARKVMEPLLAQLGGYSARVWTHAASLELHAAQHDKCRGLYKRAVGVVSDPNEAAQLHAAWLEFEALHGTLAQLQAAEYRVAARSRQLNARAARAAEEAALAAQQQKKAEEEAAARKRATKKAKKGGGGAEEKANPYLAHTVAGGGADGGAPVMAASVTGHKRPQAALADNASAAAEAKTAKEAKEATANSAAAASFLGGVAGGQGDATEGGGGLVPQ